MDCQIGKNFLEITKHAILLVIATITVMMSRITMSSSRASETTATTATSQDDKRFYKFVVLNFLIQRIPLLLHLGICYERHRLEYTTSAIIIILVKTVFPKLDWFQKLSKGGKCLWRDKFFIGGCLTTERNFPLNIEQASILADALRRISIASTSFEQIN